MPSPTFRFGGPFAEESMSWKPIVAGVDASPEAAAAAVYAWRIAQKAGTTCHLVHATRDAWAALTAADLPERFGELDFFLIQQAREQVAQSLGLKLPAEIVADLKVVNGRPPIVLNDTVAQLGGGMIVLGGKHHSTLGRWLGGSTSHNMVRAAAVPVLVTAGEPREPARILVSVDVSPAAKPTLELAERLAALFGAKLRAISVMEPLPLVPEAPPVDMREYYQMWEEMLKRDVWPLLRTPGVETMVRHGNVIETLLREVHDWPADILVVGSHGKNLAQRMLLGSVTEQLLNHLPTSVLVAPIGARLAETIPVRVSEFAIA
jgi:nucleotide-binding universal stress UspA family protein